MMVADAELLARGVDAVGEIQFGRVDAEVDVGHERSEQDHTVAVFNEQPHVFAAHRSFVNAQVQSLFVLL